MNASKTKTRYYATFIGYGRVPKPIDPIAFEETIGLDAYYKGIHAVKNNELLSLEKIGLTREVLHIDSVKQKRFLPGCYLVNRTSEGTSLGDEIEFSKTANLHEYVLVKSLDNSNIQASLVSRTQVFKEEYAGGEESLEESEASVLDSILNPVSVAWTSFASKLEPSVKSASIFAVVLKAILSFIRFK